MAIVTRYFATAAAGAGDGSTWANRALLINAGTWSSVITGFAFNGSDSLCCLVGPGTYTVTASMAAGLFANAPSATNRLFAHGCDSSGNRLVPQLTWRSNQLLWDTSNLPVLATTTNVATWNLANSAVRMLAFTASGATSAMLLQVATSAEWCSVANSTDNTGAVGVATGVGRLENSIVTMSGASFRAGVLVSANNVRNTRFVNLGGATSGNRHAIEFSGAGQSATFDDCTATGFQGDGIGTSTATAVAFATIIRNCTLVGCRNGIQLASTASQTGIYQIEGCLITGNSVSGIDGQSQANALISRCRLRDNNAQNLLNIGNQPSDWDVITAAGTDAAEFVDAANGDYRTRIGSLAQGYGVGDQILSGVPRSREFLGVMAQ